jgi:hypothetical protein
MPKISRKRLFGAAVVVVLIVILIFVLSISGKAGIEQQAVVNSIKWDTYSDTEYGFEFKYPENWNLVGQGELKQSHQLLVKVVNPERAGKPDTDVPIEQFLVRKLDIECKGKKVNISGRDAFESKWGNGFAHLRSRESCLPLGEGEWPLTLSASAGDRRSEFIMNEIFSSFQFTRL